MMLFDLALYAFLGMCAGLLSGTLGVGGGIVIVPMLVMAFGQQGFAPEIIMHLALGTSLASIIFTSLSSTYAQHKRNAVDWNIVKNIALGIVVGTYCGSIFASNISANYLQIFFALFLLYVAYHMLLGKKVVSTRQMPKLFALNCVGVFIGFISSLVGIGGGTLSVTFMLWHNVDIRKAIASSSAIGIFIALSGALGYLINGLDVPNLPLYSLGYLYLPALCGIVLFSVLTAPFGVKLAHSLPISTIKKVFSILLIIVSLKMLFDAL